MKKILMWAIISTIVLAATGILAQIRKIPAVVTKAFKEKFPNAGEVTWKDKLTDFEASFDMEEVKYQSTFSNKGEWKHTEKMIAEEDLPEEVQDGLEKSKYKT